MAQRVILRFRDLVTEPGGTIAEHRAILRSCGEVWWGWWMRQYETPPRALFAELREQISRQGSVIGYLFNTGAASLFSCQVADIKLAPGDTGIGPPEPAKSPEYYHRGRYPAWFLLKSIRDQRFEDLDLVYDSFPTKPELYGTLGQLLNQRVASLEQLRHIDVTLWVVQEKEKAG